MVKTKWGSLSKKKKIIVCLVAVLGLTMLFGGMVSFAGWGLGQAYKVGDTVEYNGDTYECRIAHTVYDPNWNPVDAPALWVKVTDSTDSSDTKGESSDSSDTTDTGSDTSDTGSDTTDSGSDSSTDSATTDDSSTDANTTDNSSDSTDSSAETVVSPTSTFGDKVYSPYADMSLYVGTWGDHSFNLASCNSSTGQKFFTMAFVLSSGKKPAWGGNELVADGSDDLYMKRINDLRNAGGDVMVSFGGANGTELAMDITDVNELVAAYQLVIDRYELKWIDLDIEGAAVADKASIDRRNKAMKILQKNNPDLTVAYCLPALPTGLTNDGVYVIENAKENGVRVDVVNVMAMDYGDWAAPNPSGKMGEYAIQAAKSTYEQVVSVGIDTKIGITPMIGVNDVATEVFTLSDAKVLRDWAASTDYVRLLSMWSVTRDNGDLGALDYAVSNSSSLVQEKFDFVNTFKSFTK